MVCRCPLYGRDPKNAVHLVPPYITEEAAVGKETVFALDFCTSSLHLSISFLMSLSISYETLGHLPIPRPQPRIHATQV